MSALVANRFKLPSHEIALWAEEECEENQDEDADVRLSSAAVGTWNKEVQNPVKIGEQTRWFLSVSVQLQRRGDQTQWVTDEDVLLRNRCPDIAGCGCVLYSEAPFWPAVLSSQLTLRLAASSSEALG